MLHNKKKKKYWTQYSTVSSLSNLQISKLLPRITHQPYNSACARHAILSRPVYNAASANYTSSTPLNIVLALVSIYALSSPNISAAKRFWILLRLHLCTRLPTLLPKHTPLRTPQVTPVPLILFPTPFVQYCTILHHVVNFYHVGKLDGHPSVRIRQLCNYFHSSFLAFIKWSLCPYRRPFQLPNSKFHPEKITETTKTIRASAEQSRNKEKLTRAHDFGLTVYASFNIPPLFLPHIHPYHSLCLVLLPWSRLRPLLV